MTKQILRVALNVLSVLALLGTAVFLIVYWKNIPDQVPTHYDLSGAVAGLGGKRTLWLLVGAGAVVQLSLCFTRTVKLGARRVPLSPDGRLWLCGVRLAVTLLLAGLTVMSALARPLPAWGLPASLALVLIPVAGMAFACLR